MPIKLEKQMRLTKKTIEFLNSEEALRCRNLLALALNKSQYTIQRYINENNDELTKAAALEVICKETGMSNDEILKKDTAA